MRPIPSLRVIRFGLWAAILVFGAALVTYVALGQRDGAGFATASIGGPFSLTDQHGKTVTEAALKGHPSALFFGYTYCPDVCPTTLYEFSDWLQKLGPDGDKLKVFFVTVDPERDTEKQLAAYLEAFDPRITGLTGPRPAIDQILKEYHVYSRKVPLDGGTYSMDHTAAVYLLDAEGGLAGTVDYKDDTDIVMKKLKRLVASS